MKHKGFTTVSSKYTDQIKCTAIYGTTDVGRKTTLAFPFKDIIKKENLIWLVTTEKIPRTTMNVNYTKNIVYK